MHKKELVNKIYEVLKDNNIRKYVAPHKTTLHITDDDGGRSDFVIRKSQTGLLFTSEDITVIIDAYLAVIEDALKRGDEITIQGFGTFALHKRAARKTVHPKTGEPVDVVERYIPKFTFGNRLRTAARMFSVSANEMLQEADNIIAESPSVRDEVDDGCD